MNKFIVFVIVFSLFFVGSSTFASNGQKLDCKKGHLFSFVTGKPCKVVNPVKLKPSSPKIKFNNCSGIACTSTANA
jgi:hypothetical protein